jgi:hypothetical protein
MRYHIISECCCTPSCGTVTDVAVDWDEYCAWIGGALILAAMPTLSATEREVLLSGMCVQCQRDFFIGDHDDDEV